MRPIPCFLALSLAAPAFAASPVQRSAVVSRAQTMFRVADRDHDGTLSRDEFRAAMLATARRYDPKIQASAVAKVPALARFDALTAGTGGRMTEQRFVAEAVSHFDAADLNHDGTVTPEEARRFQALMLKGAKAPPSR